QPGSPIYTPTPDFPHDLPPLRAEEERYIVKPGDTLGNIALAYNLPLEQIVEANQLTNPNLLEVGQELIIPQPTPQGTSPAFKIIPDSELVYGPMTIPFDLAAYVAQQPGYIARYSEEINDQKKTAAEIVQRVAQDYSVNPRLLLAILEYQSGWLSNPNPTKEQRSYPVGLVNEERKSLYRQLAWAANQLNRGYYLWRVNGLALWNLVDGTTLRIDPTINAGTAAVQHLFAQLYPFEGWTRAVTESGLFATFQRMFGYPFDYAIEPLLPPGLYQPYFQLPFEDGVKWVFTGGPHGAWDSGSAWGALDFAPDREALGCVPSDEWVVAMTNGPIVRVGEGVVIQDVDDPQSSPADGFEQTGWVILYMHIESRDRVSPRVYLKAGERIGHPSCEGGLANGTHVHIARKYHGEWIPADQSIPFVLDGWVSVGTGVAYDGFLRRDGIEIEAYAGQSKKNQIGR
ncbi:MAG: LysM peptidoglycan-binding domain-containing protein, partial [Anaerolineales bacterium]|nr:LysM peptidoglycan-binding domain-containing protein [Anaerolineales bacterium]